MIRIVVLVVIVAAIVGVVRLLRGAGSIFRIRIAGGTAGLTGTIPGRSDREVVDFIDTLGLPDGAEIRGVRDEERFRVEINGKVPEGERQRVRNFLYFR